MLFRSNLIAHSDMSSIVDSMVAPLSVINALIMAICMKQQKKVVENLEVLEEVWEEYQVYGKDEIDYINDSIKIRYAGVGQKDHER